MSDAVETRARKHFTPLMCREARKALGWTLLQLAVEAGLEIDHVQRFERHGDATPETKATLRSALEAGGIQHVRKIGELLDCDYSDVRTVVVEKPVDPHWNVTDLLNSLAEPTTNQLNIRRKVAVLRWMNGGSLVPATNADPITRLSLLVLADTLNKINLH